MDDQKNLNNSNQNPVNPSDQSSIDQNPQPIQNNATIDAVKVPETPSQEDKDAEVPSFVQMDSSSPLPPPIPTVEEIPNENQGTSVPNLDIPPIISNDNKPKKKFGGKTIATILGILILLVGIGAGVFLLNQQQDVRTQAGACCGDGAADLGCGGVYCCVYTGNPGCPGGTECKTGEYCSNPPPKPPIDCSIYEDPSLGYALDYPTEAVAKACCPDKYYTKYGKWYCGTPSDPTTPPNPTPKPSLTPTPTGTPPINCQCLNIKAYDTSWNLLTVNDLSNLQEGDKVRFTVAGTATSGTFDKAKFTINSVDQPETTAKKPSSEEFYTEYTIPAGVTTFTINAQIHHLTQGWK